MKTLILKEPTKLYLEGFSASSDQSRLASVLAYHDKKIDYEYSRIKNSGRAFQTLVDSLGGDPEAGLEYLKNLKASADKSLLFQDEDEALWTYSGLKAKIAEAFTDVSFVNHVKYPEEKLLPWAKMPTRIPRYYQTNGVEALVNEKHAGVSIATGLGKSKMLQMVTKHHGLQTLLMSPSVPIGIQLFEELVSLFGKKNVGFFGDGKKDFKKRIVVGIAASLTKVEPGSDAWKYLSKTQVFLVDESHQTPAQTLQRVCFSLVAQAPYRYFFSATQIRGDGLGLVLEGITGPIVYNMDLRQGVDEGFLAKPIFTMIEVESDEDFWSKDSNALTRAHLFYNQNVIEKAAFIINASIQVLKRPVIVLVEELEQFTKLLPLLKHEVRFAHGPVSKENADTLPKKYHKVDNQELVKQFNAEEYPILVGTSCIATGIDIQAAKHVVYLRGGASEIEVRQGAIGRGTRLVPGKTDFIVTDFDVVNQETLHRHAEARVDIYKNSYGPLRRVRLNGKVEIES